MRIIRDMHLLYDSSLMGDDEPYELLEEGEPTGIVELPVEWIKDDYPYFGMDRPSDRPAAYRPIACGGDLAARVRRRLRRRGLFLLTMHPLISLGIARASASWRSLSSTCARVPGSGSPRTRTSRATSKSKLVWGEGGGWIG